jgi:hypothetical protein
LSIRIKNWSQFQHFKDRRPPWVKLYRDLLDDMEWHELDANAAKALVMFWLIASETDGELPDTKKLAFRLRMSEKECLDIISKLSHWLEHDDINAISTRYQVAPVADVSGHQETETETEKISVARGDLPQCNPQSIVALYHEVLPELPAVRLMNEARKKALGKLWRFVLTSTKTDGTRRAYDADQAMTWLRDYFSRARDNDFLMGRTGRVGEHSNWQCDLDFLLTDKGMKHVIEKTKENA